MNKEIISKYLHPINITTLGGIMCLSSATIGSPIIYTAGKILDLVDGSVARNCDLQTKLGAIYDPLIDKASTYLPLSYLSFSGDLKLSGIELTFIGANLIMDSYKQIQRQNPLQTILDVLNRNYDTNVELSESSCRANTLGKIKSISQGIGTGIAISETSSVFNIENYALENISPEMVDIIQTNGIYSCFGLSLAVGLMSIPKIRGMLKYYR